MDIDGNILMLDLAKKTGWAVGIPGERPRFGHFEHDSSGVDYAKHNIRSEAATKELIDKFMVVAVGYEQISLFGKTTPATVMQLCSHVIAAERAAKAAGVPIRCLNPSQLKKFFTGSGKAKKEDMKAFAWKYGFRVIVDDEADAIAGFFLIVDVYGTEEQRAVFQQMRFEVGLGRQQREVF